MAPQKWGWRSWITVRVCVAGVWAVASFSSFCHTRARKVLISCGVVGDYVPMSVEGFMGLFYLLLVGGWRCSIRRRSSLA